MKSLSKGDVLLYDLLMPGDGQLLLPAGTVLDDDYIFKILKLGVWEEALRCVDPDYDLHQRLDAAATRRKDPLFDYSLFQEARLIMLKLEECAKAWTKRDPIYEFREGRILRQPIFELIHNIKGRIRSRNMADFIDLRVHDVYDYAHSINVCTMSLAMGAALDWADEDLLHLGAGALLADIGMFLVPPAIRHKAGTLEPEEEVEVRSHVARGYELLKEFGWLKAASLMAMFHHHERMDGSGYPRALKGSNISEGARLVMVADVYDAMISDVPYRRRNESGLAHRMIMNLAGAQFDATATAALAKAVAPYPLQSKVQITGGQEAAVILVESGKLYKPVVQIGEEIVDLSGDPRGRRIVQNVVTRRFYRQKLSLACEYSLDSAPRLGGTMLDISLNGMCIRGRGVRAHSGQAIEVMFILPGTANTARIKGKVIWARPDATGAVLFGVATTQMHATNQDQLLKLIMSSVPTGVDG
ncbi:MAG: PilZ domain-containing protein [Candidatus Sericytochromatia bacterium]|nr:PilZ domain-containing protein [Candidatus Tanganyikabacteria bacterium]